MAGSQVTLQGKLRGILEHPKRKGWSVLGFQIEYECENCSMGDLTGVPPMIREALQSIAKKLNQETETIEIPVPNEYVPMYSQNIGKVVDLPIVLTPTIENFERKTEPQATGGVPRA